MHVQFLDYFMDPETKKPLSLEVTSKVGDIIEAGFLKTNSKKYPIVRGVPRFVDNKDNNYSKSFSYQWHRWQKVQFESENVGMLMEGHTRRMWERITGINNHKRDLVDKIIVDIGCGPGRFIEILRSKGAKVIGIDYSGTVEVAHECFKHDPDVCICQADALNLPLNSGMIDGAFSIGVLHHTPNPEKGVQEAFRILCDKGWFAICVYGKGGYYDFPTVQLWRKFFKYLWPIFGYYPPLIYTYFTNYFFRPIALAAPPLGNAIRLFCPFVKLPGKNWSLLDTFDSVTPSYQSAHECYEVFNWLKESGFVDIEPTNWGFTSFSGIKRSQKQAHDKM